jgi:TnpA family transposase
VTPKPSDKGGKQVVEQSKTKRLKIVGPDEIEAIYARPHFTNEERILYFTLAPPERTLLPQLRTIVSRIFFILQLGFFKARHQFFVFSLMDVEEDAQYVQETYFPNFKLTDFEITKITRLKQQGMILALLEYRYCDMFDRQKLASKSQQLAQVDSQPIYLFRELIQHLARHRLIVPGYSFMQDTVGQALTYEQNRLIRVVHKHLTETDIVALKNLLDNPDGLYEITRLKRAPKDFGNREIAHEVNRGQQIQVLYQVAKRLLRHFRISNESVKYYASLVNYYSVFQLSQLDEQLVHVYLLCFVYHRYQKLHDNLINSLIYHIKRYDDEAKNAAKERVYAYHIEHNRNLKKAGQVLKLLTDNTLDEETPLQVVRKKAFSILDKQELDKVADHLVSNAQFDETAFQWEHIDSMANRFKRCFRPILRTVLFNSTLASGPLLDAAHFLRATFQRRKSLRQVDPKTLPLQFVPDHIRPYLYDTGEVLQKSLLVDRYEFLVYRLLRNKLEAGDIYCRESVRFRSFEDDLLDDRQWQKKDSLIANTGLPILKLSVSEHLKSLEKLLEDRLRVVNQRISSGQNEHIQIKKHGQQRKWTLPYVRANDAVNHPFFDGLPQIDIQSVLQFTDRHCQFMDVFVHVLHRYSKQEVDDRVIAACLVAWGTNMGLGRMGEISDVGYQALATTSDNFLRLETLRKANDRVSNAIAQLPVFQQYMIDDTLHSSSDGQKFETRIHTLNARYSPKYFGLKKGVVAYTLIANHIPVNARIIGANEHESHYVFDLLFNNTTEVQPTIHSTDTHGANEVNFAILHFFGYQFAPRYQDIYGKVRTSLYGFKHPRQYDEQWLIRPTRKVNPNLVVDEWENMQRIIVSLALKTTTQNIIIGKLSAFARKNKTRKALWEYDNIIRSIYLLNYIDLLSLRQNVQQALNRGESYHQLRRAVSYANFGKLRFRTEYDQQLWSECSRLLTNCIIFYNATILSNLLLLQEASGNSPQINLLKRVSPVAWQHINFYGRYEFTKSLDPVDMDEIVQRLATRSIPLLVV